MIGIIGAMEAEVAILKDTMEIEEVVEYAGMNFCRGRLNGREAVVVRSGIGKVNAAVCAQVLVDKFQAEVLINTGVAGSLDAAIDIGDIVISTAAVQHDMDATVFGDPLGQVPQMDTFLFPADECLVQKAKQVTQKQKPDKPTRTGILARGHQSLASKEAKEKIVTNFHALCAEMEGAAIAHAAYLNKVSCVIIRAISDKADNSAVMDYPEFEKRAIRQNVRLVTELVAEI